MDVTYLRYQDDILILCKSERQLKRCKTRINQILQERGLQLSRRKTCMGDITRGFHFLGVQYMPPQSADNTNPAIEATPQLSPIPHPRTLRNAHEQVNIWLPMMFLFIKSKFTCFDGYIGRQTKQVHGINMSCCSYS